jgi:hypothetical protein
MTEVPHKTPDPTVMKPKRAQLRHRCTMPADARTGPREAKSKREICTIKHLRSGAWTAMPKCAVSSSHNLSLALEFFYSAKIIWLFSTTNCTARFFACISVISRSILTSRMILGAKTTAMFFGDILLGC